jgi:aminoglycoside phosphotransferase (APT) family kinase protein
MSTDDVVGQDVNPLPVDRALRLLHAAKTMPHVDPQLVDLLATRLVELRTVDLDADDADHIVHGDAHLGNLIAADDNLQALLDFEWVRLGPRELELQPFLRVTEPDRPTEILSTLAKRYPRPRLASGRP